MSPPVDEGLNAVYRIDRAEESPAVVKTATFASDAQLLTDARLTTGLESETAVPLPMVYEAIDPEASPLRAAAFVMKYCPGREATDIQQLSPAAQERLITESGHHLAAIHRVRPADGFGPLRLSDDTLVVQPRYDSWSDWFDDLVADVLDNLRGEGYTADSEARFVDLVPEIRESLGTMKHEWTPEPAVMVGDYRPANLVLDSDDGADPIIRAVIDVDCSPMLMAFSISRSPRTRSSTSPSEGPSELMDSGSDSGGYTVGGEIST